MHERPSLLAGRRVVEEAVAVDTLATSLKNRVTQHILRVVVRVLPNKRDRHLVLMLEGFGHDGPTIGALDARLSCPTTEVRFFSHFGSSFPIQSLDPQLLPKAHRSD